MLYPKIQFLLYIYSIYLHLVQGQRYNLTGSSPYGVKGEDFRFLCEIPDSARLSFLLMFIKDGMETCRVNPIVCRGISVNNNNRYKCGCINNNNKLYYMNISSLTSSHHGNWTCTRFYFDRGSNTISLLIYDRPNITRIQSNANNNQTEVGSRVVFSCFVDADPRATITWTTSKGEQLSSTGEYILPRVTCAHTDNYTCTAGNDVGLTESRSIPLYVTCSPIIDPGKEIKKDVSVSLGDTAKLPIHVLAWPLPVFTWHRLLQDDNEKEITDFRMRQTEEGGLASILIINDVNENDLGRYIVYVRNAAGVKSTIFKLCLVREEGTKVDGITVVIGVVPAVTVFILTSLVCVCLHRSGKLTYSRKAKDEDKNGRTFTDGNGGRRSDNIGLSDVHPVVYDSFDENPRGISNTSPSPSPSPIYDGLQDQTREASPYNQLSL